MDYKTNPWTIVLTTAITAVVIGGGFFLWQNQATETEEPRTVKDNPQIEENITRKSQQPASEVTRTTKSYTSKSYAVSFEYPDDWTVNEDLAQLDVQPPLPAQLSNYFTLEILGGNFAPNKTLKDFIVARNLKKANFTIDGQNVYTESNTDASGTMLYFLFSHQDKVYQLHLFKTWYDMPEVQAMIASLQLK